MTEELIKIEFEPKEQQFLAFVFMEVFGGGSTGAIQRVLGEHVEAARELEPVVKAQSESDSDSLELTESQWRIMYDSLNAVIYGLGPTELQTCTGRYLHDACNLILRICDAVWGVYRGKYEWTGSSVRRIDE